MAKRSAPKKTPSRTTRTRKRKAGPAPLGLAASETVAGPPPVELGDLTRAVEECGGGLVGS